MSADRGAPKTLLVTYCCRDKDPAPGFLPARDRYLSPRIHASEGAARRLGWDFMILSGLHGLLGAEDPLAYYDHLLTADQIEAHAARCAGMLAPCAPQAVVLLTRTETVDPGVGPYRACLAAACTLVGVDLQVVEIGAETPSADELADLLWDAPG